MGKASNSRPDRVIIRVYLLLSLTLVMTRPIKAQTVVSNENGAKALSITDIVSGIRDFRRANEHNIIRELDAFLKIPNTAADVTNIRRNAALLEGMLQRRAFETELLPVKDRGPIVFGALKVAAAERTVIFYCHYDGQPADPAGWTDTRPFDPALRTASIEAGGRLIPFPDANTPYENDWRIYARSAADDKSPIVMILSALDALATEKVPLGVNVKFILDSEEEAGSPHLEEVLNAHKSLLKGDLLISADGPIDQGGRPQIDFGNRGIVTMKITVYGPLRPLHSGHYGNWAPNPAMRLAQLLASMEAADGHVLIDGFYDGVLPLGGAEEQAFHDAPDNDSQLSKQFGLAQADGNGQRLLQLLAEPSLNIDSLASGWSGKQQATAIPDKAVATLDLRLVKNIQPGEQVRRLIAHIRKKGYLVLDREPTPEERSRFARIARVDRGSGYPAAQTSMELPVSRALMHIVDTAAGEPAVKMPTVGGSLPMYIFEDFGLPVIVVPMVNYDDNQHAPNENVRLGNLWQGMEIYGAILAVLKW